MSILLKVFKQKKHNHLWSKYIKDSPVCGRVSLDMPKAFFKFIILLIYLSKSAFPTRKLPKISERPGCKENISQGLIFGGPDVLLESPYIPIFESEEFS